MIEDKNTMDVLPMIVLGPRDTAVHRLHLELNLAATDGFVIDETCVRALLSDESFWGLVDAISDDDVDETDLLDHIRQDLSLNHVGDRPETTRQFGISDFQRNILGPIVIRFVRENMDLINNIG